MAAVISWRLLTIAVISGRLLKGCCRFRAHTLLNLPTTLSLRCTCTPPTPLHKHAESQENDSQATAPPPPPGPHPTFPAPPRPHPWQVVLVLACGMGRLPDAAPFRCQGLVACLGGTLAKTFA